MGLNIILEREHDRISDYSEWDPQDYLNEYYCKVMPDERLTMQFLIESLSAMRPIATALEFGCGPTIHHSAPLVSVADEIHMSEYLASNRAEITKWLHASEDAFDWSHLIDESLRIEGVVNPTVEQRREREQQARRKVTQVLPGNAFDVDPLGPEKSGFYNLVTSHYCAEACTTNKPEWSFCMSNIAGLVAPNGTLILSACNVNGAYTVGKRLFPCAGITEVEVVRSLRENGFTHVDLRVRQVPMHSGQGYGTVTFARAVKAR
jgi:hypothetical protein